MKRFRYTILLCNAGGALLFLVGGQFFSLPVLGGFLLVYLGLSSWVLNFLTTPLKRIIEAAAKPFPLGLPEYWEKKNGFTPLVLAINTLIEKVRFQMQHSQAKDNEMVGILDSLNEGVIAFNVRAKVIFMNQIACKMLGRSRDALVGSSLDTTENLLQKCHEMVLQALQTSESVSEKWTEKGIYFDLVASPLIYQTGAILVVQDKTSDYKILEMGKNFIANASHELRTPITIIRGSAEMLQHPQLSAQTKLDITDKIIRTSERLNKLVKSLLTIADLENFSEKRFRSCDVMSIAQNCKHLLESAYPGVEVVVSQKSEGVNIFGDADLLDLALMNLLENGVKYSSGAPFLEIGVQKEGELVCVRIKDQGIGIPTEDLPYIFDRFYTVDKARSRKNGGAGLGLSIVKTIVDKHRGSLKVTSEIGKGSVFSIELPGVV